MDEYLKDFIDKVIFWEYGFFCIYILNVIGIIVVLVIKCNKGIINWLFC